MNAAPRVRCSGGTHYPPDTPSRCSITVATLMQYAYDVWSSLARPWQTAFEAAWASWRAGSLGVGAVITNADGAILAVGQNRLMDAPGGPGPLAGIPMAHAEMNALASLPPRDCGRCALYTTLEPCFMCSATISGTYHIPRVFFAAHDPWWDGLAEALGEHPVTARSLPQREHLGGPYGVLAYVLPVTATLQHWPAPLDAHERLAPARLALAQQLLEGGVLTRLAQERVNPPDVAHALWDDLCRVAASGL